MKTPPVPIPVLVVLSILFFAAALALIIYWLWLRNDLDKTLLSKDSNWRKVELNPIALSETEEGPSAVLMILLGDSSSPQELTRYDKVWRKFIHRKDGILQAKPMEGIWEVCLNGSFVLALRQQGSKKYFRFSKTSEFSPNISPPNPQTIERIKTERKVIRSLAILLIPSVICWLFLLFSIVLF